MHEPGTNNETALVMYICNLCIYVLAIATSRIYIGAGLALQLLHAHAHAYAQFIL
jgi:hypothetical protein